jgi:hypothetical protein
LLTAFSAEEGKDPQVLAGDGILRTECLTDKKGG